MGHSDLSGNGLGTQSEPIGCWKHLAGASGDQLSHTPVGCERRGGVGGGTEAVAAGAAHEVGDKGQGHISCAVFSYVSQ